MNRSPSTDLVPVYARDGGASTAIPIAQMRPVYRLGDIEQRLSKLPPKDHEGLRATYERMLEKGADRFQVSPPACR